MPKKSITLMAYKGNDFFPLFPILPNNPVVLTASTEKQISLTLLVSLFLTQFSQICTKTKIIYVKPMKS